VVRGVYNTRLEELSPGTWRVTGNGACRTMRFDNCELYPDMDRSAGLLGFRQLQGSLYVSLDQGDHHVIALGEDRPAVRYLVRASADIVDLSLRPDGGLTYSSAALDSATYIWANMAPATRFEVSVDGDGGVDEGTASSDSQGELRLDLRLGGDRQIRVIPVPARRGG
jgi:hypothetical protein